MAMPFKKDAAKNHPAPLLLNTPLGSVEYTLTRKRVKNINLRVRTNGTVVVSAPKNMPMQQVASFLAEKAAWVAKSRAQVLSRPPALPCTFSKKECLWHFTELSNAVFPLFCGILGGQKPHIKVRNMKSRWGSCNIKTRTITLNMRLMEKDKDLQEYVVLHEYVHFLHPNHQPPFHAEMARLMPDYKLRRKRLKD